MNYFYFKYFLLIFLLNTVTAQNFFEDDQLAWCATSEAEYKKCNEWSMAIEGSILNSQYRGDHSPFEFHLSCVKAADRDQCMNKIANNAAHLITLDPGEVFIAGRHYSLVPIMVERYGPSNDLGYYSVALIKRNSQILTINDLKNKKACFSSVGQMAGWTLPISKLLDEDVMEVKNCNNMVKTVANFFNNSCAPNSLIDKYNPSGDNPQSICSLCHGSCSGNEHYSNFDGALRCLANVGDVAFVKHNTVDLSINQLNHEQHILGQSAGRSKLTRFDFELLCPQGGKAPIDSYLSCNWGFTPAHAVVVTSSMLPNKRLKVQEFLYNCSNLFNRQQLNSNNFFTALLNNNNNRNKTFELFGSPPINMYSQEMSHTNLLFSEDTSRLVAIEESKQTFKGYLGDYVQYFEKLHKCPVPLAKLCITSEKELAKCNAMVTAFRAQMLKPQLACVLRNTSVECMQSISEGLADLTVLDAGDIHKAGHLYKLIPIVAEKYNLEDTNYYAVAVAKQSDKDIDLLYLKNKRSCHAGYLNAASWVMPINFLLTNNRMRNYGCNSVKAASQFFSKSCVPGALSPHYTKNSWTYGLLCELCHGSSFRFCSRNHNEPFYGNTGALRCLVEGGGDVAFIRHTTILENTAGRNPMFWSRNIIANDFELLCRDGSRAKFNEYRTCNLGKIPANAIVTSQYKLKQHIDSYVNLFIIAQELYGSKYSEDYKFKMFVSPIETGYNDLIFQDATTSLIAIPESKRDFIKYLGSDFLRAIRNVDCASHQVTIKLSSFIFNLLIVINLVILFKK